MIRVGLVGLGKMGLSHFALINAHPSVDLAGICDSSQYVLGVLGKYTGVPTYNDYDHLLSEAALDAVVISTPSRTHATMVRAALGRDLHVFCEKPFTLDPQSSRSLAAEASARGLISQVGYHNRHVGAFREVKRLLDEGAIGDVTHVLGEAYGPVVLKAKGTTWRTKRTEGGGCLYDYAAHPLDLLNWYLGPPAGVGGSVLNSIFSPEIEDEVFSTLFYPGGTSAQISVNWSDESQRKMTTSVSLWGTKGRIYADRQECRAYLRADAPQPAGYTAGWNVRYTTELTEPVWFYLRGEEYSAQVDTFLRRIDRPELDAVSDFDTASETDEVIAMILADAGKDPSTSRTTASPELPAGNGARPRDPRSPRLATLRRMTARLKSQARS